MYQKVCCKCKVVFFLLIRKTIALHVQSCFLLTRSVVVVVFNRSRCFHLVFGISRLYILFEEFIDIEERFGFSPGYIYLSSRIK